MKSSHFLFLALAIAACHLHSVCADGGQMLQPFQDVKLSGGTNLTIVVSPNNTYFAEWTGYNSSGPAVTIAQSKENLFVNGSSSANSTLPELTLRVPERTLGKVKSYGAGSINISADAIKSDEFNIESYGMGSVHLLNTTTKEIEIDHKGTGLVVVTGAPHKIEYDGYGAGTAYLTGVTENVKVDLNGSPTVFVSPEVGATIEGSSKGVGTVHYSAGSCLVKNPNPTASSCEVKADIKIPESGN